MFPRIPFLAWSWAGVDHKRSLCSSCEGWQDTWPCGSSCTAADMLGHYNGVGHHLNLQQFHFLPLVRPPLLASWTMYRSMVKGSSLSCRSSTKWFDVEVMRDRWKQGFSLSLWAVSSAFSCPSQLLVQRPTVTSGLASDAETSAFNWILYQCHCIRSNSYNKSHILLLFSTVRSSSVSLNKPWCIEKLVPEVVPEDITLWMGTLTGCELPRIVLCSA